MNMRRRYRMSAANRLSNITFKSARKNTRLAASVPAQAGIGLPAAIFVITLMAVIAVAVNQLVSQNTQTYEEEINLTRAFYAAESGAGFAMNTLYPPEEYSAYATTAECATGPRTYNFSVEGINNCSAVVTCTEVTISGSNYATIESEGSCGDLERTVQVQTSY
jgi:MSHA biogenesis protein MshP